MPTPPRKKRARLFDLKLQEISLVDRGANQKQMLIHKRQEAKMAGEVATAVGTQDRGIVDAVNAAVRALAKKRAAENAVQKELPAPPDQPPATSGAPDAAARAPLTPHAQAALAAVARLILPFKNEITMAEINSMLAQVGIEAPPDAPLDPDDDGDVDGEAGDAGEMADAPVASPADKPQIPPPGAPKKEPAPPPAPAHPDAPKPPAPEPPDVGRPPGVDDDTHARAKHAAQSAYMNNLKKSDYKQSEDAAPAESGEQPMPEDNKTPAAQDAVFKAYEERIAKSEARAAAAEKRADEQADVLKRLDGERLDRQFSDRAAVFKHVALGQAEVLKLFRDAHAQSGEDGVKNLEAVLKAADEQVKVAKAAGGDITFERGTSQSDAGATPESKLESLIDARIEKGETGTRAQVATRVYKTAEGAKLRAQIRKSYEERNAK